MALPISAQLLRRARSERGFTQREVAARAGVPPSTVARVESGRIVPRADTLARLLRAAGSELTTQPVIGEGVDRTLIRRSLAMTPAERLRELTAGAHFVERLRHARRVG